MSTLPCDGVAARHAQFLVGFARPLLPQVESLCVEVFAHLAEGAHSAKCVAPAPGAYGARGELNGAYASGSELSDGEYASQPDDSGGEWDSDAERSGGERYGAAGADEEYGSDAGAGGELEAGTSDDEEPQTQEEIKARLLAARARRGALRDSLAAAVEQEDRVRGALAVVRALAARVAAYPGGEDAGYAALPEHELQRLADANAVLEAAAGEDGGALESGEEDWEEEGDEDADEEARGSGVDEHDSDAGALSSGDEAYGSDLDASGDDAYNSCGDAAGSAGDEASGSDAEAGASGDEAYGSDAEPYDSADEAAGSAGEYGSVPEADDSAGEAYGSAGEYGSDPEAYGGGDGEYGSDLDAYGGGGGEYGSDPDAYSCGSEWEDGEGGTETEFLDGLGAGARRAWYAAGFRPAGSGLHRQFLLTGDTGTGKSVALAALAHYMRAMGAVVRRLIAVIFKGVGLGSQGVGHQFRRSTCGAQQHALVGPADRWHRRHWHCRASRSGALHTTPKPASLPKRVLWGAGGVRAGRSAADRRRLLLQVQGAPGHVGHRRERQAHPEQPGGRAPRRPGAAARALRWGRRR